MERQQTQLESVDEIRAAIKSSQSKGRSSTALESTPTKVKRFKPTQRTPIAVVTVMYDGLDDGERFTIRNNSCVIGRADGDIVIENDTLMSTRHFELFRPNSIGARWRIKDLGSTNGTFARTSDAILTDQMEFLVGVHRYRFLNVDAAREAAADNSPTARNSTQAWQIPTAGDLQENAPAIVEVTQTGDGRKYSLTDAKVAIGTDESQCQIVVDEDQFVDAVHAVIQKDEFGRWHLTNQKTLNGTWVRFTEIPIDRTAQVQAGEQRFSIFTP